MRFLAIFLCIGCSAFAQNLLPPVGAWREHLPYGSTIDVTASAKKIYAATPYSLVSVDLATNEVERISKISGLSETGISAIHYSPSSAQLFIAYTNANVDVLEAGKITNIADLKRKNIAGDKTIYHIFTEGSFCYLSTGIGVVVLDARKYEIKDTWLIGKSGGYLKVNMLTREGAYYYAATEEGLKRAPVNGANLADFRSWQTLSGTGGLPAAPCKGVLALPGKIVALQNDTLFAGSDASWSSLFSNGIPVLSITLSENKLTVTQRTTAGFAQVVVLNEDGSIHKNLQQPGVISFPKKAILKNGEVWVADLYEALSRWRGISPEVYKLTSPEDIATGQLAVYNNVFYAAAGSVNNAWNYQYNGNGVYQFKNGTWTNYNRFNFSPLDSLLDFIALAVDPRDETVWAGSFGGGLLHMKEKDQFQIHKQGTPLEAAIGDPGSYRISGLAFDADQHLWVANYGALRPLHVLKNNGTWQSFSPPFFLTENAVAQIIIDDNNQKWMAAPKGNGLICFNHGASLENSNDDNWRLFKSGKGNGNLPSNEVLSIAKDKSGAIWIGTSDGIGVIQCGQDVFSRTCEAELPVAAQGGFASYLFKGEEVRSMAVDGANRKWIGTGNGVWLLSADGSKIISRFTEENSPLLSNDVQNIAISDKTGEVFFATAKGILSFRGTATAGEEKMDNLVIFPNPVPPGYGGTIAIKGLVENSWVKITELNGRLVYQTRSLGGQAIWNGKDYKGGTIASGVYLILVSDEGGSERTAGKIVIISK